MSNILCALCLVLSLFCTVFFSFITSLCLTGEAGVGKTAIAEGVAQILAAPNMVERVDELFDQDEDGGFVDEVKVKRLEELAALCPPRLRNHRVISLELANLVAGTKYRGEFEERLQAIVEEVTDEKSPPTILFIDGECSHNYVVLLGGRDHASS